MPAITKTVGRHEKIVLTVPPSDTPQEIEVKAWRNIRGRRSEVNIRVAHNGIDIGNPVADEPRHGEKEFEVLDRTSPAITS